ncbi:hypothetical protein NUM_58880 [Actinocatenispora comari]|uniref:Uncharacterized protein n=1 Tax=Actinocatenispora comari TaxID=2807577 RepID=A0A8J4AH75_9ACTN|nr:hypothetical protein NUM_58880 [Actinocatenispora comari]
MPARAGRLAESRAPRVPRRGLTESTDVTLLTLRPAGRVARRSDATVRSAGHALSGVTAGWSAWREHHVRVDPLVPEAAVDPGRPVLGV